MCLYFYFFHTFNKDHTFDIKTTQCEKSESDVDVHAQFPKSSTAKAKKNIAKKNCTFESQFHFNAEEKLTHS